MQTSRVATCTNVPLEGVRMRERFDGIFRFSKALRRQCRKKLARFRRRSAMRRRQDCASSARPLPLRFLHVSSLSPFNFFPPSTSAHCWRARGEDGQERAACLRHAQGSTLCALSFRKSRSASGTCIDSDTRHSGRGIRQEFSIPLARSAFVNLITSRHRRSRMN